MNEDELIEREPRRDIAQEQADEVHQETLHILQSKPLMRQIAESEKTYQARIVTEDGEISLKLSPEVMGYFHKESGDWQSKINDALKAYIFEHPNTITECQKRLAHRISAVEQMAEMFLEDLYSDKDPFWNYEKFGSLSEAEKLRVMGIRGEERYDAIIRIIGNYGLRNHEVSDLFFAMEYNTIGKIKALTALVRTTEPEQLRKYGVPDRLIENAKLLRDYKIKERSSGGGKGKAKSINAATKDKAKIEWGKWHNGERKCEGKAFDDYGAQSAFASAMVKDGKANSFDVAKGWDREWRKNLVCESA